MDNPAVWSPTDLPSYADPRQYVSVDDRLLIQAIGLAADQTITITGRLLLVSGDVKPIQLTVPMGDALTLVTATEQLAQGFLLGLEARTSESNPAANWTYVKIGLTRGGGSTPLAFQPIMAGYVGNKFAFGWPHDRNQRPTDGPGTLHSIEVTQPAVGTDWTYTVPANVRQQLVAVCATYTADALSAASQGFLQITDGTNLIAAVEDDLIPNPGGGSVMTLAPALGQNALSTGTIYGQAWLGVPTILGPGWTVGTLTPSINAADQWGPITLAVLEWLEML